MHDSTVKTIVIVGGLAIGLMGIVALASSTDEPTPNVHSNQTILPTPTPTSTPTETPSYVTKAKQTSPPKPTDVHCVTTDVATNKLITVSPGDRAVIGTDVRECTSDGSWARVGPAN